jgi:hypothetical protein
MALTHSHGASQAAQYPTATRGPAAPETRICYERADPLCHSLDRPLFLYVALAGQWRYSWLGLQVSLAAYRAAV